MTAIVLLGTGSTRLMVTKHKFYWVILLIIFFKSFNAHANVIQYFTGISYSNPAALFQVKQNEMILGGTGFHTDGRFQGSALNFNSGQYDKGIAYSRTTSFLPYARIAGRLNKDVVFAVDVTQPFHSNLNWQNHSVTRFSATQTYLTDVDVSPRASYSFNQKWHIGAGLNFNFLNNNEANWALPVSPDASANLVNQTSGFGLGYNLGIYHVFNPQNFLSLTYYSSIKQHTRGTSTLQARTNTDLEFDFRMPATTVVNYAHLFNKQWLASLQLFYSEWSANQFANFNNTSAPPPLNPNFSFKMHFRNSLALLGVLRHQYNDKFGLTLLGMIDDGPERDKLRTLNFPADKQYFIGLSGEYRLQKNMLVELLYGYGFSNTSMNNQVTINGETVPFTTGKVNIHANIIDLKFKIQV